jgi:putative salt-induced outer membrane protein
MLLVTVLAMGLVPAGAQGQAPPAEPVPCVPAPPPPPPPDWTGSLGAGLSVTTGNSDTLGFNLAFGVKYAPKGPGTFKADALYILQRNDGARTVDKINALGRYEYSFAPKVFAFGEVAFLRDVFKNVDYLVAPIVGVGYKVVDTKKLTFAVDGGLGGAFEKDTDVDARSSGAWTLGESFSWKLSPGATVTEKASALFKMNDSSDYNLHFEAGIAAALTNSSELKVNYLVDFKNLPAGGASKTDSTLVVTLIWKM